MRIFAACCVLIALVPSSLSISQPKNGLALPRKTSQRNTGLTPLVDALSVVRGGGTTDKKTRNSSAGAAKAATIWRLGHGINLHKLLVGPFTALLMMKYACFTPAAWLYLALHGSYGVLWVAKDVTFPDQQFQAPCSFLMMIVAAIVPTVMYFPIPWVLVHHANAVPEWYTSAVIAVFNLGMFLMVGSDCQKHFTLKAEPGKLITSGFFKYIRSPNYLGEIFIYLSFSMLTYTPLGFVPTLGLLLVAMNNSAKKDRSMSRHPEFAAYKAKTYRFLPPFI